MGQPRRNEKLSFSAGCWETLYRPYNYVPRKERLLRAKSSKTVCNSVNDAPQQLGYNLWRNFRGENLMR